MNTCCSCSTHTTRDSQGEGLRTSPELPECPGPALLRPTWHLGRQPGPSPIACALHHLLPSLPNPGGRRVGRRPPSFCSEARPTLTSSHFYLLIWAFIVFSQDEPCSRSRNWTICAGVEVPSSHPSPESDQSLNLMDSFVAMACRLVPLCCHPGPVPQTLMACQQPSLHVPHPQFHPSRTPLLGPLPTRCRHHGPPWDPRASPCMNFWALGNPS